MSYRVGQILFVVLNKKVQIYPMMVVEEIVKRSLDGESVNYVLQGGSDSSSTILLNQVDGEIFESADEAKYVLTERATEQIQKMVDAAIEKSEKWYKNREEVNVEEKNKIMELSQESIKITLSDGTIANLKTG